MTKHYEPCKCCGHPVPKYDVVLELARKQLLLFAAVERSGRYGISVEHVADKVYADDPDGGPINAHASLYVMRVKINEKLRKHGLVIVSNPGTGSLWRLEQLEAAA